ncbi:pre-neck appendage protein [Staphylococcus phage S-CoN_Ph2]|nr:pre-neck appendage protein [Staphylococcus phage S-CoN_Ph1]WNM51609.1 pre-neck appendage protein [Staphylococcus phage S-CoN_Ph2]WNM52440.1 pre-neck appendage protein [Staphylococcus phage S-CoN_Ph7]WNM53346.1 pre-neck appendage protein [Staphylococcus phage S-CoN_Ph12]WNM53565.1 pre-neck appendage protein [Staphylococcus phage S-CoN_Ph13]
MILRLFLDFPVELGQEFRYKTVENFKRIVNAHGRLVDDLEYHRKEEKHAHDAKQIDYTTSYSRSVSDALDKQNNRINNLVVGANGDAMAEVKDSRVALDGTISELLSQRLDYDFGKLNKKIDDNFKYLNDKIERIVNVNDYGADPTGQKIQH